MPSLVLLSILAACSNDPQPTSSVATVIDSTTSTAPTGDTGIVTPPTTPTGHTGDVPFEATFQSGTTVEVAQGMIEGINEGGLRVFRGIPYAEPPVGSLRLRDPQPPLPFNGTFDASDFGPACPQGGGGAFEQVFLGVDATDEDCLSLNIWAHDDDIGRPVMVWIHGGAFVLGAGSQGLYEGTALAEKGPIIVSINYRLGALGFLAAPGLGVEVGNDNPGNFGIKDQLAALQWVRDNIAVFGGDPNNITLFGESAGGISVCALGGAPSADGLYQQAIIQSGVGCNEFAEATTPTLLGQPPALDQGMAMLEASGCADEADRLACLQALPVERLVNLINPAELILGDPNDKSLPVSPYVDGSFIVEQPIERYRSDLDVPMIMGTNADESTMFFGTTIVLTHSQFRDIVGSLVPYPSMVAPIADLYPILEFPIAQDAYLTFMTDVGFSCPNLWLAQKAQGGAPVYVYEFQERNLTTIALGSHHALELPYVFGTFPELAIVPIGADYALADRMQTAWTQFAYTGVPELPNGWPAYMTGGDLVTFDDVNGRVGDASFRGGRCEVLAGLGLFGI